MYTTGVSIHAARIPDDKKFINKWTKKYKRDIHGLRHIYVYMYIYLS